MIGLVYEQEKEKYRCEVERASIMGTWTRP
jgi:hypothetical protein